jgi:hypothetical protein
MTVIRSQEATDHVVGSNTHPGLVEVEGEVLLDDLLGSRDCDLDGTFIDQRDPFLLGTVSGGSVQYSSQY